MQHNYSLTDNLANSFIIKTLATELTRAIRCLSVHVASRRPNSVCGGTLFLRKLYLKNFNI